MFQMLCVGHFAIEHFTKLTTRCFLRQGLLRLTFFGDAWFLRQGLRPFSLDLCSLHTRLRNLGRRPSLNL